VFWLIRPLIYLNNASFSFYLLTKFMQLVV